MSLKDQNTIKNADLAMFCYQFAIVLKSGIPYVDGLHLLSDEILDGNLKKYANDIAKKAQEGVMLSEAFRAQGVFPVYMLEMITISEQTGRLAEVFDGLSNYYEQQDDLKRKLRSALTYPMILLGLMFGVVALLIMKILPIFHDILTNIGGAIPKTTQVILSVSLAIKENGVLVLTIIALLIVFIYLFINTNMMKKSRDRFLFKSPFTRTLYKQALTVKFANALGMLIQSGMDIYSALALVCPLMDNEVAYTKLNEAAQKVKEGSDLDVALQETGLFSNLFLKMIQIGQKSGSLEETLQKSAVSYGKETERSLHRLTVSVEPTLVIILSLIVGAILLLVMLPLIDIMSAIG